MKTGEDNQNLSDYQAPLTDDQAERMERGLRRLLSTPPQPRGKRPGESPAKSRQSLRQKGREPKVKSPS
jgi:hypothetical protein